MTSVVGTFYCSGMSTVWWSSRDESSTITAIANGSSHPLMLLFSRGARLRLDDPKSHFLEATLLKYPILQT